MKDIWETAERDAMEQQALHATTSEAEQYISVEKREREREREREKKV